MDEFEEMKIEKLSHEWEFEPPKTEQEQKNDEEEERKYLSLLETLAGRLLSDKPEGWIPSQEMPRGDHQYWKIVAEQIDHYAREGFADFARPPRVAQVMLKYCPSLRKLAYKVLIGVIEVSWSNWLNWLTVHYFSQGIEPPIWHKAARKKPMTYAAFTGIPVANKPKSKSRNWTDRQGDDWRTL